MSLLYKAVQSPIKNKDGKKQWHPRIVKSGDTMNVHELGLEITKRSSMTSGDTMNVIETMIDIIRQNLMNGRSVCLDRFGTFTTTCRASSNGVDTAEEVTSDQITELKVRFTPSYTRNKYNSTTRAMYQGVTFKKVELANVAKKPGTEGSGNEGGGNGDDDYTDPDA